VAHLTITLFGRFQVKLDGVDLADFGTDKNRALLAYLAVECASKHRREELASLFWPDHSETRARNSLRQALFQLRRVVDPHPNKEPHLLIQANQVEFNCASDYWVDVLEFKDQVPASHSSRQASLGLPNRTLEGLRRAVDLYRGDFLAGLTLRHCAQFSEWQTICQEFFQRQVLEALSLLSNAAEASLQYDQLLSWTQRRIELEPWGEAAYRQQMWAYSMTGQREKALRLYAVLADILKREMDISPTEGTRRLYQAIRSDHLLDPPPASRPPEPHPTLQPAFTGRQPELAKLDGFLQDALAGCGRVAFVSGETGSGKTALLNEFASRAAREHPDLLIVSGSCNSYQGLGDSFQPFREILEAFAGISSLPLEGRQVKDAGLVLLDLLMTESPGLAFTLLPALDLVRRIREETRPGLSAIARMEDFMARLLPGDRSSPFLNKDTPPFLQSISVNEQFCRLLQAVSQRFPVIILLDNLQWADAASASLLFHLGRHISKDRIFICAAYRLEDLAAVQGAARHPLAALLNEFQRLFGAIQVNLDCADGRAFIEGYLDRQPNHFDNQFREMLFRLTDGNPLFTEETLRALQARGDVVQDDHGCWVQGPGMNWNLLPPRVEAVLSEQVSRLDEDCLILLKAASLLGEESSTLTLAQALGVSENHVITSFTRPICRQHLRVSDPMPEENGVYPQFRFQFRNLLLQKYLQQTCQAINQKPSRVG
jgi:DNA-binding SARP family transcriptional activator